MLFMGQEFNSEQPRNVVTVDWPADPTADPFFVWAAGIIGLRRANPGLRMDGYDPAADGRFAWILGPWMDSAHGGGRATLGWRARPDADSHHDLVVLLNFEPYAAEVDLELGRAGTWRSSPTSTASARGPCWSRATGASPRSCFRARAASSTATSGRRSLALGSPALPLSSSAIRPSVSGLFACGADAASHEKRASQPMLRSRLLRTTSGTRTAGIIRQISRLQCDSA